MNETSKRLHDYDTETTFEASVLSTERITSEKSDEEVRELTLEVNRADFPYSVGQSIGVLAPTTDFGQKHHFRLYGVADIPEKSAAGKPIVKICVRRCTYVDDFSGEEYKGVASNYLCDLRAGDTLTIAGPFGLAFEVPEDMHANLILIGSGTGIAPFRALVRHLYENVPHWKGRIWLFYGAKTSLELLYMNDEKNDFAKYYDKETFEAFNAFSPRPHWADPIGWDYAIKERGAELWELLSMPSTYIYVAGLESLRDELESRLAGFAGSREKLARRKSEMMAGGRWIELLY